MTDDQRWAALFREAADLSSAPPPSFDYDDVVAASRRATARRRALLAGAAVVLMAGTVVIGVAGLTTATSEGPADHAAVAAAPPLPSEAAHDADAPEVLSVACPAQEARAVRAAVEQAVVEVAGVTPSAVATTCGSGGWEVTVRVAHAGRSGVLIVSYLSRPGGTSGPTVTASSATATRTTPAGGVLTVQAHALDGGPAPLGDQLDAIAAFLAARL